MATVAAAAIGSLLLVFLSDWNGDWLIENGPAEMLQVGALFAATVLFSRAGTSLRSWAGRLAIALASFSFLFLIRELPRCGSPYFIQGVCFPGDTKTFAYFLPLPLPVLLYVLNPSMRLSAFERAEWGTLPRAILRSLPLVLVPVLLAVGQIADGRGMPFLEEMSELLAYCLLALAGMAAAQERDRRMSGADRGDAVNVWATT